ncbi:MAG: DUF3455 domain-containing protein [Caldilineaceae bacterium]
MKIVIAALAFAFTAMLPHPAHAGQVTAPPVPPNIQVPAGNEPFLVGHAVGTQNYVCLPSSSGVAFKLFTPQATLFQDNAKQIGTHFFSPNPAENGTIRATWQDSLDTSAVWGEVKPGNASSDANYVQPGAIPWLLVTVVGSQDGTIGRNLLTGTRFIQRVNTTGGLAPSTGCASPADIGTQAFVPYTADYYFFRDINRK